MQTANITKLRLDKGRGVSAVDGSTQAKIERAALNLFAQHGIDGVSTKQIAAQAETSEGALYRYYPSKDALAQALMKTIHERLSDMIRTAGAQREHLSEQIRFIVTHYCRIADDDWMLFQYHILHLHHFSDLGTDSPIKAAADLLMRARNYPNEEQAYLAATMALGAVLQPAQAKIFGYVTSPLSDHIDMFITTIFAMLNIEESASCAP